MPAPWARSVTSSLCSREGAGGSTWEVWAGRPQDCSGVGGAWGLPRNKSALGVLGEPRVSPSLRPNQCGDKAVPSVGRGLAAVAPGRSRGSGMRGAHGPAGPWGFQPLRSPGPRLPPPCRPAHRLVPSTCFQSTAPAPGGHEAVPPLSSASLRTWDVRRPC